MKACVAIAACCALAACATAETGSGPGSGPACKDCPTAQLTANGSGELQVAVGTDIAYAWMSSNADQAASTVTMTPGPDACGNHDGPWVVNTLSGSLPALPLLPCQAGTTYTLELTVTQSTSAQTANASVTIAVQ